MKSLPIAIKWVLNVVFFVVYSLFGVIAWNFVFWLILTLMWKIVPGPDDIIHTQIAVTIILLLLILTLVFRKYFYFKVYSEKQVRKTKKKKELPKQKQPNKQDNEIEILLDKEIK